MRILRIAQPDSTTFAELIAREVLAIGDGFRAKVSELGGDGPIFLRAVHVRESGIDLNGAERFRPDLIDRLRTKMSKPGDTVVTTKGNSTGRTTYVPAGLPEFVYSPHLSFWRVLNSQVMDSGFLRYWARSDEFVRQLRGMMASTDMAPYLSLVDQRRLRITLPPVRDQRAIARVLGTLDDKIELNRRMNETLEAIARAIFKSWFVDFDPVRAKTERREPAGIDRQTAELFPDSFSDFPIGRIPNGWVIKKLSEIAAINARGRSRDYPFSVIEYVDISSVTAGRLEQIARLSAEEAPSRAQRLVVHGDVIWSCVRPNRRSYLFIYEPSENLVVSTGFAVLSPTAVPPAYLYAWVTTDEFVDYLTSNAHGSAYPAVRPQHFAEAHVLVPPSQVLERFEDLVGALLSLIARNERQARTLAAIRDALLPKLLSGEIRVREAEELVEAAT